MKRLAFLFTINCVVCFQLFAQILRPEIELIAKEIAIDNELKSEGVGFGGERTAQWERFVSIKTLASNEELTLLTNHENGVVRCYSFLALAARKTENVFTVLIQHLSDSARITTYTGCIVDSDMVGDYFLDVVTPNYIDLNCYKLTPNEKHKVDSLLIFDKNVRLEAKSELLKIIPTVPKYYERMKEILLVEKIENALIALARYQKDQDKDLIIERLRSSDLMKQSVGLRAVRFFADSSFYSYVANIHQQEINSKKGIDHTLVRNLYQAIVQYKNLASRTLLEETLSSPKGWTREKHSEYIWLALELFPDPIYDGLQSKIKLPDYARRNLQFWIEHPDR